MELDFHRTLDGVIVLFHDDSLERLVDGIGRVDEHYYEELLLYTYNALPAPRPIPSACPRCAICCRRSAATRCW